MSEVLHGRWFFFFSHKNGIKISINQKGKVIDV